MSDDDMKATVSRLRAVANQADLLARTIEDHRVTISHGGRVAMVTVERSSRTATVTVPNAASMVALAQVGTACRDFRNAVEGGLAALPQEYLLPLDEA